MNKKRLFWFFLGCAVLILNVDFFKFAADMPKALANAFYDIVLVGLFLSVIWFARGWLTKAD